MSNQFVYFVAVRMALLGPVTMHEFATRDAMIAFCTSMTSRGVQIICVWAEQKVGA